MDFKPKTLLAVGLLAAMMQGAAAQSQGPGRALAASNIVRLSADTLRTGDFVAKQFIVPHAGVVRLRYTFKSDGTGLVSVSASTAIDNDNSCGASSTSATFQTKQCDLKVVAGDRVRISGSGFMDPVTFQTPDITIKNVRLLWNVVDATSAGSVLLD